MTAIHCIVTVHGMGEPLPNSTLMPVAERISQIGSPPRGDTLSLGLMSGLTGPNGRRNPSFIPCIQLKGVSLGSGTADDRPIYPYPVRGGGNLFFADIFWSDITSKAFPKVGDTLTHWTQCLLNRLDLKHRNLTGDAPGNWWVPDVISLLRHTLVFAERGLSLRNKGLNDVIFGKYLGDVQLYGEYAQCRGNAVRLFHDSMAKIHAYLKTQHEDREIEFTIIAHSLGTVMSLDSLMLAHARKEILNDPGAGKSEMVQNQGSEIRAADLPFPGYAKEGKAPDVSWLPSVKSFVTLGSPIDKFLTIWWYNYAYLLDTEWLNGETPPKGIKHYNFCDEQDPVGHRLDFARTAPAFRKVFGLPGEKDESDGINDVVYNHTPIPGWAHVSYWKDQSLFDLIHGTVIAGSGTRNVGESELCAFGIYRRGVFFWILLIHYYLFPAFCILLSHFTLTWALTTRSWHATGLGVLGFVLSLWYGRQILMLNLGWRQVLKQKSGDADAPRHVPAGGPAPGISGTKAWRYFFHDKAFHSACARISWRLLAFVNWAAAFALLAWYWDGKDSVALLLSEKAGLLIAAAAIPLTLIFVLKRMWMKMEVMGKPPKPRYASFTRFRAEEITWAGTALLPFFLMPFQGLRNPILDFWAWVPSVYDHAAANLASIPGIGSALGAAPAAAARFLRFMAGRSDTLLLFTGVLVQLSALYWTEVWWLHRWIKKRIKSGSSLRAGDKAWEMDFKAYSTERGADRAGPAGRSTESGGSTGTAAAIIGLEKTAK